MTWDQIEKEMQRRLDITEIISNPEQDEAEWHQLEVERRELSWYSISTGCGKVGKPHPESYGKDLPMRGMLHSGDVPNNKYFRYGLTAKMLISRMQWPKEKNNFVFRSPVTGRKVNDHKSPISDKKAHAKSYRPDLPLQGLGLNKAKDTKKWSLTAAEKKELADRPLRHITRG